MHTFIMVTIALASIVFVAVGIYTFNPTMFAAGAMPLAIRFWTN